MDARQKTKVAVALVVAQMTVAEMKEVVKNKDVIHQCEKIEKWVNRCADKIRAKRMSAGANRDALKYSEAIKNIVLEETGAYVNEKSMTAQILAADALVTDVCNAYQLKGDGGCWFNAKKTINTLAECFRNMFPEYEEVGTSIYLKAESALEI